MKLRVRSSETKETIRVEAPDSSSLPELKGLIAAKLSSSSPSSLPIPPESVRLSLNRTDELVSSDSLAAPLSSLGLTSGDLLYFSLLPSQETAIHNSKPDSVAESAAAQVSNPPLDSNPPSELMDEDETTRAADLGASLEKSDLEGEASMDVDDDALLAEKSPSVPGFLRRVMEAEMAVASGGLGLLAIAVHAVLLESGFVVCDGGANGTRLPEGWASKVSAISIRYTVSDLLGNGPEKDAKVAVLKFSAIKNFASVYGFVNGDRPDVCRVCLDMEKLMPSLISSAYVMSEGEEKEVFEFWKVVKDGLCLPLLIDICEKNGLPSPPCFARLPTDLKMKILELLHGVDLASIGGASSELRYLSSNDELWKQNFEEEFGVLTADELRRMVASSWKARFVTYWKRKKDNKRNRRDGPSFRHSLIYPGRGLGVYWGRRYPIIGGDYDLYPAGGVSGPAGLRSAFGQLRSGRRNFSPHCNLGGSFCRR